MKILRTLFRILVGLVFVFSGFVKGIDPLGTVFRMDDYFMAFNMPFFKPWSLYLTIILCALEFLLGISLLFNLWIKKTAWLLLPMMIFFTVLTYFDAFYNVVPDCGCFGDALKLTNMQTFVKNLVLMAFIIPIFIWRKQYRSLMKPSSDATVLVVVALAFMTMSVYCYTHLPLIDFMSWKVGNKVNETARKPVVFYVTYKNKITGEEKEYISPNYPWNDSTWLANWIFQSQRVVDPNTDNGVVLKVEDASGNDFTSTVLNNPGYQFLLIAYDLETTNTEAFHRILPFYKRAVGDGYSFICLTSTTPQDIRKFRINHGTAFDYFNADDIVLKVMVRSNPGLILMKDGVVLAKWPFRNFPGYDEVREEFLKK